jgi:hypothetical protein
MDFTAPSSPAVQTILTLGPLNGGLFFREIAHLLSTRCCSRLATSGPRNPLHPPLIHHHRHRERYRAVPLYSDGKFGPAIELRNFFAQFLNEVGQSG